MMSLSVLVWSLELKGAQMCRRYHHELQFRDVEMRVCFPMVCLLSLHVEFYVLCMVSLACHLEFT